MKIYTKFAVVILLAATTHTAIAASAIRDGKEWMQVSSLIGLSYDVMASNCDVTTGACTSGINNDGDSLDGWVWANSTDMASLFEDYMQEAGVTLPNDAYGSPSLYNKSEPSSEWAPKALSEFEATYNSNPLYTVYGITRDITVIDDSPGYTLAYITFVDSIYGMDSAAIHEYIGSPSLWFSPSVGHWVYRDISAVPIPAAAFMFAPALLGFMGLRRRAKSAVA